MFDGLAELGLGDCVGNVRCYGLVVAGCGLGKCVCGRWIRVRGAFVADDRFNIAHISVAAALCSDVGAEPVASYVLVGVDYDICALADVEDDRVCGVWFDGDEVGGNDGKIVIID